jgi:hypothetical protein
MIMSTLENHAAGAPNALIADADRGGNAIDTRARPPRGSTLDATDDIRRDREH